MSLALFFSSSCFSKLPGFLLDSSIDTQHVMLSAEVSDCGRDFLRLYYNEGTEAQPSAANPASPTPVLKGTIPIKRCVLFVGGIDIDCDEAALIKYCRSKNVRVSSCRFLKSKLFGTKSARLSVSVEDAEAANILDAEFWPDNITARPWKFPPKLGRPDTEILQTTTRISSS